MISWGSRPRVCRLTRRASSQEPHAEAEAAGDAEVGEEVGGGAAEALPRGRGGLADHHRAQEQAEVVLRRRAEHGHLGDEFAAAVEGQRAGPAAARDGTPAGGHRVTDHGGVGGADDPAVGIGHSDGGDPRLGLGGVHQGCQRLVRDGLGEPVADQGVRGELLGERGDPAALDPVEGRRRLRERDRGDRHQHHHDDGELEDQHLACEGMATEHHDGLFSRADAMSGVSFYSPADATSGVSLYSPADAAPGVPRLGRRLVRWVAQSWRPRAVREREVCGTCS